jgi:D-psicose/D-tagatose/L-ribulose 3-epimerase
VAVLSGLAHDGGRRRTRPGLEICNGYETSVVNTANNALWLADDIGATTS